MGDSSVVEKTSCPHCPSSDAYAIYDDGHAHCFSCGETDQNAAEPTVKSDDPKQAKGLLTLAYRDLSKRRIDEATCRKYGYGIAKTDLGSVQVANFHDSSGAVVAQKMRTPDKDFPTRGDIKKALLFGQQLWRHGGKFVVVTEGEIDCLSVAQAMGLKWPVVSIKNGAKSAVKNIKEQLEWLTSHEHVILWFDNDEPGREAAQECAVLFPAGKVKIITSPGDCKDANDVLREMGQAEVARLVWDAPVWRPDGIISGEDISLDELMGKGEMGWALPWPEINKKTRGIRRGEVVLLTAGSGIGKSTDAREILYKAICDGLRVGAVFLEESKITTAKALVALDNNVPLSDLREDPGLLTREQWEASRAKLIANGRYHAYDHFGSVEGANLLSRLEFLAVACECELIVFDHISIAVSGLDIDADERRIIDMLMTKLRSLSERTGTRIIVISHLRKVGGGNKSFELGGEISLDDLRGSGALKQLSDTVIARERNQQAEEEDDRDIALHRVLKCRYTGLTGPAGHVRYVRETGRVVPVTDFEDSDPQPPKDGAPWDDY